MFQGGKNKVSQETQSPVTKLFKSLACSDSSSETVNLVKQKKKKLPTSSQPLNKCECTDAGQQTSVHKTGSAQNRDDTFSFTSCSLKKLLASESPRLVMALILAVGFLTVILVVKCICCPAVGVDLVQETRDRRSNDAVGNDLERKPWEMSKTKLMSEFSELTGKETRDTHLQSGVGEYPEYLSPDLASVLDPIKVNEGYGSNSLRDFYRKLLKTDIQIKNLKKGFANIKRGNIDLSDPNTPRLKRSPNIFSDTNERYAETPNKDIEENFSKYDPKSNILKTEKGFEKNKKDDFDTGVKVDSSSNLEKIKAFMEEKKLQLESKELKNSELLNSFQFEDSEATRNNIKNHKYTQRMDVLFGRNILSRVTPSTQHRRLLQHDDKDDDDDTTEDYEEQTKEPWDREKRTVSPLEIYIKTEKNFVTTNKSTKPKTSNFKEQTTHYSDEINFLIEAALKMKSDNSRGKQIKLKNAEANTAKGRFFKMLREKTFVNNIYSGINNSNGDASKMPSQGDTVNSSHIGETSISQSNVNQKTIPKHKELNVMYSGHRRSLKSIDNDRVNEGEAATISDVETTVIADRFQDNEEYNLTYFNNNMNLETTNEYNTSVANKTKSNIILALVHEDKSLDLSENNLKLNNSTSGGLGEIFSMLADFFVFLSGFDTNQEDSGYRFLNDFVTMLNPNLQRKNKTSSKNVINNTKASNDLEIKEIVGHRSRVLMSFEDKEENVTSTTGHEKEDMNESYVIANKDLANASIERTRIINSSSIENKNAIVVAENRTVVKRSATGDSIFWNDMYDDEYGIKDPMEDDMKDKSSVKFNDLIGKDNWIGTKFRMIAKSFKERRNRNMEKKKDRKNKNFRNKTKTHTKRSAPVPTDAGKRMFEGLTANMKRVCHEAAEAIRDTTNREVRADSDQASTLMQQLVGLMSELVDLQVREKTCVQLPEDLRSFLAWLTSPSTEERSDMGFSVDSYDPSPMNNLHNMDDMLSSNTRSDCLGTIHDVEDLILQYDEMSEEDKSKMSGVREYLEHQLHYLHKQLSNFNEFGSSAMYREQPIRRRRQQKSSIVKQNKRKAFKFLNYYGKKHTKHTFSDESLTEDNRNTKKNVVRNDNNNIKELKDEDSDINDNTDRRLSKKVENSMKKSFNDFFKYLVKNNNTFVK